MRDPGNEVGIIPTMLVSGASIYHMLKLDWTVWTKSNTVTIRSDHESVIH